MRGGVVSDERIRDTMGRVDHGNGFLGGEMDG